ncbi:tetratricopeptide repeat protein [Myxococcota bacterium]|nr:tetratricopeptide repeat protein [Myxococcota bacterium]
MPETIALMLPRGGDPALQADAAAALARRLRRGRDAAVVVLGPDPEDLSRRSGLDALPPPHEHPAGAAARLGSAVLAMGVLTGDAREVPESDLFDLLAGLALASRLGASVGLYCGGTPPPGAPAPRRALAHLLAGGGFAWTDSASAPAWRALLEGRAQVISPGLEEAGAGEAVARALDRPRGRGPTTGTGPGGASWLDVVADEVVGEGAARVLVVGGDPAPLRARLGPRISVEVAAAAEAEIGSGATFDVVVVPPDAVADVLAPGRLRALARRLPPSGTLLLAARNGRQFRALARAAATGEGPADPLPWQVEGALRRAGFAVDPEIGLDLGYGAASASGSGFERDGGHPATRGRGRLYAGTLVFVARPSPAVQGYEPAAVEAHMEAGRTLEALHILDRALQGAPLSAEIWNDLGVVLHVLERPEEALQALVRCTEIDPLYAPAWQNLAQVLGGALPEVDFQAQLAALPPGTPWGEAVHLTERWVLARPHDAGAWNALAEALRRGGALHRAREVVELAQEFCVN